jgi:hypothetical protein
MHTPLTVSYFHNDDVGSHLCNRSVSNVILTGTAVIPAPPDRLLAAWEREMAQQINLEPGDVESLPLARARMRWPDYQACVQAAADWTGSLGLGNVIALSDIALMACRGARYHHDAEQYGGSAFCNLFLTEDKGLDLHFPDIGLRIPLIRGTVVIFDTAQPHAVIPRSSTDSHGFHASDFPPDLDCSQVFLTWELAIDKAKLADALGVDMGIVSSDLSQSEFGKVLLGGAQVSVCPEFGRWLPAMGCARVWSMGYPNSQLGAQHSVLVHHEIVL